jgi:prepilin-type N-terminal cleavage/methylation domain-containing protein
VAAFSLLELSVVLFIISVLAAFAVPVLKRSAMEARSVTVMNELRVFAGAFQAYAHERGDWPAGPAAPGEMPAGMQSYLGPTSWSQRTPIGGRYAWSPNTLQQGARYHAAIQLASVGDNPVSGDRLQLEDIDRRLDDGNLETGSFRLGYRNYPVFVIEH